MKIAAVIVTYNPDLKLLLEQYTSVCKQVDVIIYVDNNSSNYEIIYKLLMQKNTLGDNLCFIHNELNRGIGYAHNRGIFCAKKKGVDAVLILDHDSVLKDNFVKNLSSSLVENEVSKIAAVGPVYMNSTTGEYYPITTYIGPFIKRLRPTSHPVEASFLISSGSLIPLNVIDDIGGMNEELFIDYIDVEWSYRAKSKGYKLLAVPTAVMEHRIGDKRISILGRTISVHTPLRRYYLTRNSIYMVKLPYVSLGYKIRELSFNILRILIFVILSEQKMKYLKYSMRGLLDGIKGKYGKCSM
ncbi:glycosyltransferase family 2 protein [Mediterranea massiliensis]|uniref:Glycosyltransferase family 2 protein n=1 Tax=Mediterranea massiliensis TaxID=1841865 RepID=A0ABS2E3J5_9BACT|nr:glycosyltransferase family 2 protein [Mediterranea massiliensis]MBM6736207.1 glycosyltransferase family 2 protein [Mediterranea massiliensis]